MRGVHGETRAGEAKAKAEAVIGVRASAGALDFADADLASSTVFLSVTSMAVQELGKALADEARRT